MKRALVSGGALIAVLLVMASVRQRAEGAHAMEASDAALARGDLPNAIADALVAAEAVAPASPWPARALDRLSAIARDAEARADERTAIAAWSAIRAASLETAALGATGDARRREADRAIARIGGRAHPGSGEGDEVRPTEATLAAPLARDDLPTPLTYLLLAASALAFFVGAARALVVVGGAPSPSFAALRREPLAAVALVLGAALYLAVSLRP